MKKRFLILSSLITLLLTCFSLPIYADEDPTDPPSSVPVPNSIRLDQYFYDNYDLLPYIEATSNQYINTGIKGSNNLRLYGHFSNVSAGNNPDASFLYGSRVAFANNQLGSAIYFNTDYTFFSFYNQLNQFNYEPLSFETFTIKQDKNLAYFNERLVYTFTDNTFSNDLNLYLFALNQNGTVSYNIKGRLSLFTIYDYSSESYVRYFYPARSKSGGVIGLYDAVSDTFFTSASDPFTSPVNNQVLNFQIGDFVSASLTWIADILEFAIETPIILIFMAIGLAGAMFRWGRRLVHF